MAKSMMAPLADKRIVDLVTRIENRLKQIREAGPSRAKRQPKATNHA
ncbi:MAG: hypothetical protein K6T75_03150 [Acetobacteraceae bacterium]|nr:hypothetical protein [Acetobacteraceae bacterium]